MSLRTTVMGQSVGIVAALVGLAACNGAAETVAEPALPPATADLAPSTVATATVVEVEPTEAPAVEEPVAIETEVPPTAPPPTATGEIAGPVEATPTPLPMAAPGEPAVGELMTLEGAEGLEIHTTYYPPAEGPAPGVILLHMVGGNRRIWSTNGVAEALSDAGNAVLTVDMRGHGDTGGAVDWTLAAEDLRRVWESFVALDGVDGDQTAVVGASIGANMALVTAAQIPAIRTAVLLSPGLNYFDVTTDDKLIAYGDRPLMIVASEEDGFAAESSEELSELASGEVQLTIFEGAGHGTNMFRREPALTAGIVQWIAAHTGG